MENDVIEHRLTAIERTQQTNTFMLLGLGIGGLAVLLRLGDRINNEVVARTATNGHVQELGSRLKGHEEWAGRSEEKLTQRVDAAEKAIIASGNADAKAEGVELGRKSQAALLTAIIASAVSAATAIAKGLGVL